MNRERIIAWCSILLGLEAALFVFLVLWQHEVFVPLGPPTTTDFVSFYAAGKLAQAGSAVLAYSQSAHAAAEEAATAVGIGYQYFFYPPTYLLLCLPLAYLPYMVAFVCFQIVSLGGWLMVMRHILREPGWVWCVPVLAYPSVFWTMGLGQNSFLSAALLGIMTLTLDKRPIAAGIALGFLCYKPHLALLAPIALAVGGYWRTFVSASATVCLLIGLSVALFGLDVWRTYFITFAGSHSVYEGGIINLAAFVTPYGAARVLGAGPVAADITQALMSVIAVGVVAWIWFATTRSAARFASLIAGILLSVPLALIYDLLLLTIAIGWLVREARWRGFLPWEKLVLVLCYIVPLASRYTGEGLHIPLGPLAPLGVLGLAVARSGLLPFGMSPEDVRHSLARTAR